MRWEQKNNLSCVEVQERQLYEGEEFDSEKEQFDEDEDDYVEPY